MALSLSSTRGGRGGLRLSSPETTTWWTKMKKIPPLIISLGHRLRQTPCQTRANCPILDHVFFLVRNLRVTALPWLRHARPEIGRSGREPLLSPLLVCSNLSLRKPLPPRRWEENQGDEESELETFRRPGISSPGSRSSQRILFFSKSRLSQSRSIPFTWGSTELD